jgi:hypothetical protein
VSKAKFETMRRLRVGDLRRLLNRRYGPSLPNDDAGREDLRELLLAISLGPDPRRKMLNAIGLWAPWMPQDEIDALIEGIDRTPVGQRHRTGKDLGERMRLTNTERERLRLWTIAAYDMTAEERVEWRKVKARERMRRRRANLCQPSRRHRRWVAEWRGFLRKSQKPRDRTRRKARDTPDDVSACELRERTCANGKNEMATKSGRPRKRNWKNV